MVRAVDPGLILFAEAALSSPRELQRKGAGPDRQQVRSDERFPRNSRNPREKDARIWKRVRPADSEPVGVHLVSRDSIDILRARDISVGGVGVRVPHRFRGCDVRADVELVITLPGERPFSARGQIRHRGREGSGSAFFGVEFTQLSEPNRARIQRYVDRELGRSG